VDLRVSGFGLMVLGFESQVFGYFRGRLLALRLREYGLQGYLAHEIQPPPGPYGRPMPRAL
jgi:hypothetical protein